MSAIPYWHVDAFADAPFKGNQAAVMPLDTWLPDDVLQAIGEENAFAETAFILSDQTGEADYELRWFTPTEEVQLCGHATLASGHVVLTRDGGERVTFRTRRAGILEVCRSDAGYELGLPLSRPSRGPGMRPLASSARSPKKSGSIREVTASTCSRTRLPCGRSILICAD